MNIKLAFFATIFILLVIGTYSLKNSFKHGPESVPSPTLSVADKAIKIANDNGFIAKDLEVDEGDILIKTENPNVLESKTTIRIKSCSLNKTMHLDTQTFKVIKFEDEIWCGGVPGN